MHGLKQLKAITPLLLFPYLFLLALVFVYFAYQKYQIKLQIKHLPFSTIFNIDLDKVKKNLQIRSMIHSFLLVLITLEILTNISFGIKQFEQCDIHSKESITVSCISNVDNNTFYLQLAGFNRFNLLMSNLDEIFISLISPVICLLLIVLRRAFFKVEYKNWVKGFSIYILVKLFGMSFLSIFRRTAFILPLFYLPFAIFDFYTYISSARAFYVLLKGRRVEALYHSSRRDYLEKRKIVKQFYYTQLITTVGLFLIILDNLFCFSYTSIPILYDQDLFKYLTFDLFPTFTLPFASFAYEIEEYSHIMLATSSVVIGFFAFVSYTLVSLSILLKFVIKIQKFNHVNDWMTRPLMERYRSKLERGIMHGRPPFIQAFRSHLVY